MNNLSIKLIKDQIRKKTFSKVYLFSGEEEYLKEYYLKELKNSIIDENFKDFNYYIFNNKNIDINEVQDSLEAYPVMAERKLIIIKDSGIFKLTKAKIDNFWIESIKNIPAYVCLVFYENEIDKRNVLFKNIKQYGTTIEFSKPKTTEIAKWVNNIIITNAKQISNNNINYILEICDNDMISLKNEIDKLLDFCKDKDIIEKADIEKICTVSVESKVFQMIDCLMEKDFNATFRLLNDMKTLKEPIIKISYLIAMNFSKILKLKLYLQEGTMRSELASKVSIPPFTVNKYIKQAEKFSIKQLKDILNKCLEMDLKLKSTSIDDWIILEKFIMDLI